MLFLINGAISKVGLTSVRSLLNCFARLTPDQRKLCYETKYFALCFFSNRGCDELFVFLLCRKSNMTELPCLFSLQQSGKENSRRKYLRPVVFPEGKDFGVVLLLQEVKH